MAFSFIESLLAQVDAAAQSAPELTTMEKWWQDWQPFFYALLYILAIFIAPFIVARFISKSIRLPSIATRLGVVLAAATAAVLFIVNGQLLLGPDMKGGTTLVYNIVDTKLGDEISASALASALSGRIDPSGTKEISIRPRGSSQIEITVPSTDEFELQQIKKSITPAGQLEFRVVANTRDHEDIIRLARLQASENRTDVLNAEGQPVGRWYLVGREEKMRDGVYPLLTPVGGDIIRNARTGEVLSVPQLDNADHALERWLQSQGIQDIDLLIALEFIGRPYTELFGDDLASAQTETSKMGEPIVGFRLAGEGPTKCSS